ncbi:hypothetical protein F5146DRAFT_1132244 [Armillaria mellea]|nr:hypothetical protein F5146DRAFT_1132244 [Armillaria mellea]
MTKSETPRPIDLDDDDNGLVNSKAGSSALALQDDGSAAEEGNANLKLKLDLRILRHGWKAPETSDLHGPCPGLNMYAVKLCLTSSTDNVSVALRIMVSFHEMAKNITIKVVLDVVLEGFNIDPSIFILAAKLRLLTTGTPDSFTLNDLKLHGTIEHDTSLSCSDFLLGDNVHFNETIYTMLTQSNPGVDYFNATSTGQVLKKRLADDTITNPSIINTIKEFTSCTGESVLYLSIMGNPTTGIAPKKFVDIFFCKEHDLSDWGHY